MKKYISTNPYLIDVASACKHFNMSEFSSESEFWTLGHHWEEYRQLKELGIRFKCGGYHNVDRNLLPTTPMGCVGHPNTEFLQINKIWRKPTCINFDSTNVIIEGNTAIWNRLIRLTTMALDIVDRMLLNVNLMTGYAGVFPWRGNPDETISNWINSLRSSHFVHGNIVNFFNSDGSTLNAKITKRSNTQTPMLHFHALIEKTKP